MILKAPRTIAMDFGLLAIAAIPTTIGIAAAVSARKKDQVYDESSKTQAERMRKFSLECYCEGTSGKAGQVHGGMVVLRDNKLYIDTPSSSTMSHRFEGFYIGYPDPDRPQPPPLGLVATISKDPPILNWIYIDKDTREVKYGNRTQSRQHIVGSWGWDAGEQGGAGGLTLDGSEGAMAVETEKGWEIRWEDEYGRVGPQGSCHLMASLERNLAELTEQEKKEQSAEEERTNTKTPAANTNFRDSKKTTRSSRKVYRRKFNDKKKRSKEPRLEHESTTIEKP